MHDAGIVRNRLKIESAVSNARAVLAARALSCRALAGGVYFGAVDRPSSFAALILCDFWLVLSALADCAGVVATEAADAVVLASEGVAVAAGADVFVASSTRGEIDRGASRFDAPVVAEVSFCCVVDAAATGAGLMSGVSTGADAMTLVAEGVDAAMRSEEVSVLADSICRKFPSPAKASAATRSAAKEAKIHGAVVLGVRVRNAFETNSPST